MELKKKIIQELPGDGARLHADKRVAAKLPRRDASAGQIGKVISGDENILKACQPGNGEFILRKESPL